MTPGRSSRWTRSATAGGERLLVLGQVPTRPEAVGVALVVAGVAVHRDPVRPT